MTVKSIGLLRYNKVLNNDMCKNAVFTTFLSCLFFFSIRYGYGIIEGPKCFWIMAIFTILFLFMMQNKALVFDFPLFILIVTYYLLGNYQHMFLEGSSETYNIIPYTWTVPLVYLLGKSSAGYSKKNLENRSFMILTTLASGMYIQGLLNYGAYYIYGYKEVYKDLYAPNGWWFADSNGPLNWRSFWNAMADGNRNKWNNGFLIILGALFFAVLVRKTRKLFSIYISIAVVVAVLISVYFKGRAIVVLFAASFMITAFLYTLASHSTWTARTRKRFFIIILFLLACLWAIRYAYVNNIGGLATYYDNTYIFHRGGGVLNNVRLQMWKEGLQHAFLYQKGGWDLLDVSYLPTAHNTWIEFARYYDIVIFFLICVFLIMILYGCIRATYKHGNEYPVVYFAVSSVIIMVLFCMIEPIYIENQDLLLFFYFACGIVSGINHAAEQGDYIRLGAVFTPYKRRYLAVGLGMLSMALIVSSYMDWWNDRMQLLWPVIIPTIAYVVGGIIQNKYCRMALVIASAVGGVVTGIYMYIISRDSEYYSFGNFVDPFTKIEVEKSAFVAIWILPISLIVALLFYFIKVNKVVATIVTVLVTGILSYPLITDGRLLVIEEAYRLQIHMRWWLQWIASKENYYGLLTSHSMWLDFARDYGMVVLGLLIAFELWTIFCFVRMIRNGRKSLVDYFLIVAFILFNFQFMFEASAINSKFIFAMGLFVYGMITSSVVAGEETQGVYDVNKETIQGIRSNFY